MHLKKGKSPQGKFGTSSARRRVLVGLGAAVVFSMSAAAHAVEPIKIGLVAALSGKSALSGQAINRGIELAIDEINAAGGLLDGRPVELIRRDDESNPARGVLAARELIYKGKVVTLFGGLDTPVSLAIVPLMNQEKVPFMGPWAPGPLARRSPKTGLTQTSSFGCRPSMKSSAWRCSITPTRLSA